MGKKIIFIFFIFFLLGLLILPFVLWFNWSVEKKRVINILILDKTVLNKNYQEHISFNWILKNNKYVRQDGNFYLPERDYYGFFPDGEGDFYIKDFESETPQGLEALAEFYDMTYFTDMYGVYWTDWYNEYPNTKQNIDKGKNGERSRLLYGGLTNNEMTFLRSMKKRKKLIINEFNIIASPTSINLRNEYENEFHVVWSGWVGRYFENLDTLKNNDLPLWLVNNYMTQNNGNWPFKNSGIAFVRDDDVIVILENKTHLNVELPYIHTSNLWVDYYGVSAAIKYPFWFDICFTDSLNEIVSYYKLEPNFKGDSILQSWNLPKIFPAVIMSKYDYPYYYFAGDFADNTISMRTARFKHIHNFSFLFYKNLTSERKSFFWKFYLPLVTKILDDYYISLKKNAD